jgi:hypothetical protein
VSRKKSTGVEIIGSSYTFSNTRNRSEVGLQHGRSDVSDLSAAETRSEMESAFSRRCKACLDFFATCRTTVEVYVESQRGVWRLLDANAKKL